MEDGDVTQKRGPPVLQLLILEIFYLKLVFGSVKLRKCNVFNNKSDPALVKTQGNRVFRQTVKTHPALKSHVSEK